MKASLMEYIIELIVSEDDVSILSYIVIQTFIQLTIILGTPTHQQEALSLPDPIPVAQS